MVGQKVQHFENKGTDLSKLQDQIESYLKSEKFTTQSSAPNDQGAVIQAKKGGFLAGIVDADRALHDLRLRTTKRFRREDRDREVVGAPGRRGARDPSVVRPVPGR